MKKLYLEFVRGAAAITVLLYHCIEKHPQKAGQAHYYFSNWGTDAVMIFFILSGMVINISQSNNPKPKREFLLNRFIRIYPQLFASLVLALMALYFTISYLPSAWNITGNFLMLSSMKENHMNFIVPSFDSNAPIWSLSYEMFFYFLFALTIGRMQKRNIAIWFAIALAFLPLYYSKLSVGALGHLFSMMAFSAIWLTGYFIYEYRNSFYADKYVAMFSLGALPLISRMHIFAVYYDPVKYLIFAFFAVPFFLYCLQLPKSGAKIKLAYLLVPYAAIIWIVYTQPYITFLNWVLYSSLPLMLMGFCYAVNKAGLKERVIGFVNKTGKGMGKYSYSMYISHFPVLYFCAATFHNTLAYAVASLPVICILTYSFENYLQPVAINCLKKLHVIPKAQLAPAKVKIASMNAQSRPY